MGQEAEGMKGDMGKNLSCGFQGRKGPGRISIVKIGYLERFLHFLGIRAVSSCVVLGP